MLLNGAGEKLDTHTYPATTGELIDAYGDHPLLVPNGEETVGDALDRLATETFTNPEEARFAVLTGVSNKAIGRPRYSDRDPTAPGEQGPEPLSF